jgi:hypothetical protein
VSLRRILRASAVVITLASALVGLDVHVASAAAAKVQNGPLVTSATGSLALTIPAASTAGTLLVATLGYSGVGAPAFAGPAGWTRGPNVTMASGGTEIWYAAGNAGSISTVTFSFSTSGAPAAMGALSEWSGLDATSPLDGSGTATATSVNNVTVSTSASLAASGEVGITSIRHGPSNTNHTFTAGSGWTNIVKLTGSAAFTSDYKLGLASGSAASENEQSSRTGTWAAAIVTFKLPCTGGTLSVGSPSTLTLPAVSLNGSNRQSTSSLALTPSDNTGAAAGWNVQLTSTTFTNAASKTLPTSSSTITSASASSATGTCALPTNAITYPVTVPAAATAPAAVKIYNAAAATGTGPGNVTLGVQLAVPGNAYSGSYSATWTVTIASGP